jgi:hypothetical protein
MQLAFEEWRLQRREEKKPMGRWCWFLAWHIGRREGWRGRGVFEEVLRYIDEGKIELLGLAGRWLEFETRRWENEN